MKRLGRAAVVLVVLCVAAPAGAAASTPAVNTNDVTFADASTASVSGAVDPQSESTTYFAAYGPQSSQWCQSAGATGMPAESTGPQPLAGSDPGWYQVQVSLPGLSQGASLCAALVARNSSGSAQGSVVDFTFAPSAPVVSRGTPMFLRASSEQLEGSVVSGGIPTTYSFAWDEHRSPWCATGGAKGTPANSTAPRSTSGGVVSMKVYADATGLTRGASYCWQLTATNAEGSTSTAQGSFVFALPVATTFGASFSPDHPTEYVFGGRVDFFATIAIYRFEWAPGASTWCQTNGLGGSPTGSTGDDSIASFGMDGTLFIVRYGSGLSPGTAYCYRIVGTNDAGSGFGDTVPFTTPPPAELSVSVAGTGSGTVQAPGVRCQTDCLHAYFLGAKVLLQASPGAGSRFAGWRGACSGTGACTVTMSHARLATAVFTATPRCAATRPVTVAARHRLTMSIRCNQSVRLWISGVVTRHGPSLSKQQQLTTRLHIHPWTGSVSSTRLRLLSLSLPPQAFEKLTRGTTESVQLTIVASGRNGTRTVRERFRLPA